MLGVVVVSFGVFALVAANSTFVNYCSAKMCGYTNAHTFCQYDEGPSDQCQGYIRAKLSFEEKTRLLARINGFRRDAALGMMQTFPPAGNMMKMRWVEDLAREAQRWADQCRPPQIVEEHDTCRDLYSITVGQCVASRLGPAPGHIERMVDYWYIQSVFYKADISYYDPPSNDSKYYGDFAQMFNANSYMVGCGRSRFMAPWKGRKQRVERLVCNIAPAGPMPTMSIWENAAPAFSCPKYSRQSSRFRGLCEYQRKLNDAPISNPSTTLEDHLLLSTVLEIEQNKTLNYLGSIDEIYLKKLTAAKLANKVTTNTDFNTRERREVVNDSTIASVAQIKTTQNLRFAQDTLINDANTTVPLETETTAKVTKSTQTKYELNWIGRPGMYNIDDSDNFDEEMENVESIEEIPKRKKDFHDEYGLIKTNYATSNVPLYGEEVTSTRDDYEDHSFTVVDPKSLEKVTYFDHESRKKYYKEWIRSKITKADNTQLKNKDDSESGSGSGSGSGDGEDNDVEKYFDGDATDPESSRELQEALTRKEYELQPKKGQEKKVRRRELHTDEDKETTHAYEIFTSTSPPTRTVKEVHPLMYLIKLIPSLADYPENMPKQFLEVDHANRVTSSLVIILPLCLYIF